VRKSSHQVIKSMGLTTINLGKSESQASNGEEGNSCRERGKFFTC
jgi:hypothetical protein